MTSLPKRERATTLNRSQEMFTYEPTLFESANVA